MGSRESVVQSAPAKELGSPSRFHRRLPARLGITLGLPPQRSFVRPSSVGFRVANPRVHRQASRVPASSHEVTGRWERPEVSPRTSPGLPPSKTLVPLRFEPYDRRFVQTGTSCSRPSVRWPCSCFRYGRPVKVQHLRGCPLGRLRKTFVPPRPLEWSNRPLGAFASDSPRPSPMSAASGLI